MPSAVTRSVSARLNLDVSGWVAGGTAAERTMQHLARTAEQTAARAMRAQQQAAKEAQRAQEQQGRAAQRAAAEVERASARQAAAAKRQAAEVKAAQTTVGGALLGIGVAAGAGLAFGIEQMAVFDEKMSQVATLSHATAAEMDVLRTAALNAGQAIGFSATQTADAEIELVKAGLSAKDIIGGGLVGALRLAAAGQTDVATATQIAAAAMAQFKLKAGDVPHVADLLAAGADKALGSVGDLGFALTSSGTVANQFGLSIEETVGTLAEFANAGQIGERGGTLLRQMLLQLINPTKQARDIMERYGLSITDAQGNMVGTAELAGRLQKSFAGLTPAVRNHALAVIFGSHAIQGANILMSDGAAINADWTKKVDASGFAAQQAAGKMDNLKGDVSKLGAAIQSDLINAAESSDGALRGLTQRATAFAQQVGDMPGPLKTTVGVLGAATSAVGVLGGGFLLAAPRIKATKDALGELGSVGRLASRGLGAVGSVLSGPWGLALAAGVVGLGIFEEHQLSARRAAAEFAATLDTQTGAITDNTKATAVKNLMDSGALQAASRLGISVQTVTDAVLGQADAQALLNSQLDATKADIGVGSGAITTQVADANKVRDAVGAQTSALSKAGQEAALQREAMAALGGTADGTADSMTAVGAAGAVAGQGISDAGSDAADAQAQVKALDDALSALYDQFYSVADATDAFHSATNGLSKAAKDNGKSLRGNSDAAIANRAALHEVAQKASDVIGKMVEQGASYDQVKHKSETLKAEFVAQAKKAHLSGAEVDKLKGFMDRLPGTYAANITTPGAAKAKSDVIALRDTINGLRDKRVSIAVSIGVDNKVKSQLAGLDVPHGAKADGGTVQGPGGPREDKVLTRLSPGEEVIRNGPAQRFRPLLKAINAMPFANGGTVPGYASGGTVADFGEITSLIPSSTPSASDIRDLRSGRARSITALHAAEAALEAVRHRRHHTAAQVALAEEKVANASDRVAASTRKLTTAERARSAAGRPYADRFLAAAGTANSRDASFIRNVGILASRGFGDLARQLLAMGGPEAMSLAASAVRSTSTASRLNRAVGANARNQATLDSLPARLAITSALRTDAHPSIARISAETGISTSDLQAAALGMRAQLGGSAAGRQLLAGMSSSAQYVQGFGAAGAGGPQVTVQMVSTGNPWLDGQKAAQGAKRELQTSVGRW